MATRANILVISDNEERYLFQPYDGYPSVVGLELRDFLKGKTKDDFKNADSLARYIHKMEPTYRSTDGLNDNIDYLYTINLDDCSVHCQGVTNWDDLVFDSEEFYCPWDEIGNYVSE